MASKTSIANGALVKLGQDLITSITDANNKAARICNERIDNAKEVVLNSYPFQGSVKRVTLSSLTTTPAFTYTNEFQIPSDCLRFISIDQKYKDSNYAIEGDKILFDGSTLEVIYISNVTDFNLLSPLVREAISCYLAYDIAYLITNDNQTTERMNRDYDNVRRRAIAANNRQRKREAFEATDWLDSRLVGGYPSQYPATS